MRRSSSRPLRAAARAALALAALLTAGAAGAAEQLDWCAPIAVRPDQRFYTTRPPCEPWWPDDEIARRADVVLAGFLRPSDSVVPPDPSTCFGPKSMESSRTYNDRLHALAASYGRSVTIVYQSRLDLIDRHTSGSLAVAGLRGGISGGFWGGLFGRGS